MGYCLQNFEDNNEPNPPLNKAATQPNVEKGKRRERPLDALHTYSILYVLSLGISSLDHIITVSRGDICILSVFFSPLLFDVYRYVPKN